MSELPQGWSEISLGEAGEWRGGGTPSKGNPSFWLNGNIPWVSPKDMKTPLIADSEDHITAEAVASSATQLIPERSVLLVTRSGILRRTLPVALSAREVAINQDLKALTPNGAVDPEYVSHNVRSSGETILAACAKSGTTVDSIDFERLKAIRLPLPPLPEQRRIVVKIDSLIGKSRRARDHLNHIPRLVEKYKQSVLAAAFRGDLTREWREMHELPDPQTFRLGDVAESFHYGSAAKSAKSGAVPVLRMGNIQDGKLDWNDLVFTNDAAEIVKYRLISGDVLFNRTNSPALVGKSALYDGGREAIYAGYLIKVRCKPELLPTFLTYCLNSPMGRAYSWSVKSDGVSQSNINARKLAAFRFDLPCLEEQAEIVHRIETAFVWIDGLTSEATSARALIDRLDQAVLAKAFRGELVPQDPTDEPAEMLLERIRAEHINATHPSTRRKRQVTQGAASPHT